MTTHLEPSPTHSAAYPSAAPLLQASGVYKTYRLGRLDVPVLHGVDVSVARGEWLTVLGASGSGKSTLLHLLGGLDQPDANGGEVRFDGESLGSGTSRRRDRYRASRVGFVFQFYHLLPELSALDNVLLSAMVRWGGVGYRRRRTELRTSAEGLLTRLGLGARLTHRPAELSGGQRQRVAIARALLNRPDALLADEPTGNLDRETGASILGLLAELRAEMGLTLVVVTHEAQTAAQSDRTVRLVDGRVVQEPIGA